ncbi:efflux RND transporter periplasmic adaptor subunit, partial [uncultured Duncaniella sp.]
ISGQTAEGEYGIGNYVSGEGAPVKLTTIYDNSVLTAVFAIEDDRYHEIVNAIDNKDSLNFAKVPVIFEDPLPHRYFGKISYLAPTLNNSTGTLKVKVSIDNVYNELKPGMYAKIDLPYDKISDAVMVKDSSLGSDQLGRYLYVVNDSDRVVKKHVTVGDLYHDTLRVVTKGISPGERYVTKALLKVRDGMKVNPRMIN